MTKEEFEKGYWNHFLALENEMIGIGRYITIDPDNFSTYSLMLQKLILEVGSEIDNVMKELSCLSGQDHVTITQYYPCITAAFPNIVNQEVLVNGFEIKPFDGWNAAQPSQSLKFWDSYNAIKHNRIGNIKEASLGNAVTALGGLFILEMYEINRIYQNDSTLCTNFPKDDDKSSRLFVLKNWEFHMRASKVQPVYTIIDDEAGRKLI